jgi:hypothetical protein
MVQGPEPNSYGQRNKISCAIHCGQLCDHLRDYELLSMLTCYTLQNDGIIRSCLIIHIRS